VVLVLDVVVIFLYSSSGRCVNRSDHGEGGLGSLYYGLQRQCSSFSAKLRGDNTCLEKMIVD